MNDIAHDVGTAGAEATPNDMESGLAEVLERIGLELGILDANENDCIDAIRAMKRKLDPETAVAWALVQDGKVLHTTHAAATADYMCEANANCVVVPLTALEGILQAEVLTVADAIKIARKCGDQEFNEAPGFVRGVGYASEMIADEIEDAKRDLKNSTARRLGWV